MARAHGVYTEVERRGLDVAVRARYEGGRPLSGARFQVFSPARPGTAFAEGVTERHGWVVFTPDAPGAWTVRIADASGHGRVTAVDVAEAPVEERPAAAVPPARAGPIDEAPPRDDRPAPGSVRVDSSLRVLVGIAIIAGAFGTLFVVHRRRGRTGR